MSVELGVSPGDQVLPSLIKIARFIFTFETPTSEVGRWGNFYHWNTNSLPHDTIAEHMKATITLVPVEKGKVVPLREREIKWAELELQGDDGTGLGFDFGDEPQIYENDFDRFTLEQLIKIYGSHDHGQCVEIQKPQEEPKPADPVVAEEMVVIDKRHSREYTD